MDLRQLKGLEIAARHKLTYEGGVWLVPSQSNAGTIYRVTLGELLGCECDDFQLRREACKHVIAAQLVCARDHGGKASPIVTDTVPRRPTYRQKWPLYNEAQQTEKHRFRTLLFDLCWDLPDPPQPSSGRRRTAMADMVFTCVLKVYTTLSSRRFACDLADAHQRGYLSHLMNSVSVCSYLENDLLTPVLQQLIVRSSLPLSVIETDFAPDSSGFTTSRFVRWFDEKYGQRRAHDWVKVHIMTGVKTNVVTAVEIHDRDAADSPQFKPLLATTARNFTVKEVSADKAYSSLENVEAVAALNAFPAIAFKINATGGVGGAFERLFYYYSFHREEFLKTYHKRSNVESTFSMVKAKFGDGVRSKTETAKKNEVLCKLLCHNICCVIHSQIELGIEPIFWSDESIKTPVLPPSSARPATEFVPLQ
jgi:transposase